MPRLPRLSASPLFIKPTADIFIKFLLAKEENKDLLMSFINAVQLNAGFPKITSVTIKNPFNIKDFIGDKESILDVKATDEKQRVYDIEVQSEGNDHFRNRSLFLWARLYAAGLKQAGQYQDLKPAICINLLDFILFKQLPNTHTCFWLTEKDNPEFILTDHLFIHFIEIQKENNREYNKDIQKENVKKTIIPSLSNWIKFFQFEGIREDIMQVLIKEDEMIAKAHDQYLRFNEDESMRDIYEARLKYRLDYNTSIAVAEEKGKIEGKKEGKIEGKIEAAQAMLKKGYPIEDISEITGLSVQGITEIG